MTTPRTTILLIEDEPPMRRFLSAALGDTCLSCRSHDICGGGHYAHRYRGGRGFRNPSIYCADMLELIRHIRACVITDLERLSTHDPA